MQYRINSREIKEEVRKFMEEDIENPEYDKWIVSHFKNHDITVTCFKGDEILWVHSVELRYFKDADSYIKAFMKAFLEEISTKFENAQIKKLEPKKYHYTEAYEFTI